MRREGVELGERVDTNTDVGCRENVIDLSYTRDEVGARCRRDLGSSCPKRRVSEQYLLI
jgi:hypothetical protein